MKLIYGTKDEFGIDSIHYRVRNTKIISILDEFAERKLQRSNTTRSTPRALTHRCGKRFVGTENGMRT